MSLKNDFQSNSLNLLRKAKKSSQFFASRAGDSCLDPASQICELAVVEQPVKVVSFFWQQESTMLEMLKSRLALPFVLLLLSACGSQNFKTNEKSSLETVAIPQTEVRDQGRLGICWAYGTSALIESELLKLNGTQVDISEEAIAFEHMAEALRAQFAKMMSSDLLDFMGRGALPEGWATRTTPELAAMYENSKYVQHDALALIKLKGAVPESAWSFKIKTPAQKDQLFRAVRQNLHQALQNGFIIQNLSVEQIKDLILIGPNGNAFPSRPPTTFSWQGRTMSSLEFVKDVLKFDSDDWEAIAVKNEENLPQFIQLVKRALAEGHSVPLA
ncbi:hypothetical protein EBU99_13870, partial [bacterium]|nr:hypothetical protein [bacterium]